MNGVVLYFHGRYGSAEEADHFTRLFPGRSVVGADYISETPWEAEKEFPLIFDEATKGKPAIVVANSIGAYFVMQALGDKKIERAFFISPVVDMEKLILKMMNAENVSEKELTEKRTITTKSGEILSADYLEYARTRPVRWTAPTHILYGERDDITDVGTITAFAKRINAALTVMPSGEHFFHTPPQMKFLDDWIIKPKP